MNTVIEQSMAALHESLGIDDSIDLSSIIGNTF